jgi:hypothetical protein
LRVNRSLAEGGTLRSHSREITGQFAGLHRNRSAAPLNINNKRSSHFNMVQCCGEVTSAGMICVSLARPG